jgi:predicted GNAT family acetyltransferase
MHLIYIDESGTPEIPGNSSHFVLAGISIPILYWKVFDREIEQIKGKYGLQNKEIHTAWATRTYLEQSKIPDFERMNHVQRRAAVTRLRTVELLRLQREKNPAQYRQTKKNYAQTEDYIHLTRDERVRFIEEVARHVSQWGYARIFAECIDKTYIDTSITGKGIDEQAFEQVVTRFERYLQNLGTDDPTCCGLIIHDNNQTVAKKHTMLMRKFYFSGTQWLKVEKIIETPLFVDSQLTSMVQLADLTAYAIRRYLENGEQKLFDIIYPRADRRKDGVVVGVRHFTSPTCACKICLQHKSALSTGIQPTTSQT